MTILGSERDAYSFNPPLAAGSRAQRLVTGLAEIDRLDLRKVIAKAVDPDSGYGWDLEQAVDVSELYRAFLFLCKTYPDEIVVPTREVDDFWHLHILDTRAYLADCDRVFGHYLHHYPYAGLEGTSVTHEEEGAFIQRTIELVARHFPQLTEESSESA